MVPRIDVLALGSTVRPRRPAVAPCLADGSTGRIARGPPHAVNVVPLKDELQAQLNDPRITGRRDRPEGRRADGGVGCAKGRSVRDVEDFPRISNALPAATHAAQEGDVEIAIAPDRAPGCASSSQS